MAQIREDEAPTKYLCVKGDLDKLLPNELKLKFWGLFYDTSAIEDLDNVELGNLPHRKDAWRMFYKGMTPSKFLQRYGIDIKNPTVRDAVVFDLVKLDEDSVSNDTEYTFEEHVEYSTREYDRYLLNKNYRVNLVNLEKEWSSIHYKVSDSTQLKRTVDRVYQGIKMSENFLRFFNDVFVEWFGRNANQELSNVYVPFTNANDFYAEVSLIPNTHPRFRAISSRAYYDKEYRKYKELMRKWRIDAISTFALVDPSKDKTHTGWYRVKVQRKIGENQYQYVVCDIDKDG
jgi:hypothetical protein